MSTPHDTPLWLQIRNHPSLFCLHPTPQQIGTIFRVIANGAAPKECHPALHADATDWHEWSAKRDIHDLLIAEAERAELAQ
jgi:hypothetical protein